MCIMYICIYTCVHIQLLYMYTLIHMLTYTYVWRGRESETDRCFRVTMAMVLRSLVLSREWGNVSP